MPRHWRLSRILQKPGLDVAICLRSLGDTMMPWWLMKEHWPSRQTMRKRCNLEALHSSSCAGPSAPSQTSSTPLTSIPIWIISSALLCGRDCIAAIGSHWSKTDHALSLVSEQESERSLPLRSSRYLSRRKISYSAQKPMSPIPSRL